MYLERYKRIDFEIHHPELVTVQEFCPGSYLGQHIHPPEPAQVQIDSRHSPVRGTKCYRPLSDFDKNNTPRDFSALSSKEVAEGLLGSFTFSFLSLCPLRFQGMIASSVRYSQVWFQLFYPKVLWISPARISLPCREQYPYSRQFCKICHELLWYLVEYRPTLKFIAIVVSRKYNSLF